MAQDIKSGKYQAHLARVPEITKNISHYVWINALVREVQGDPNFFIFPDKGFTCATQKETTQFPKTLGPQGIRINISHHLPC